MPGSEVIWLPGRGGRHDEEHETPLPESGERVTHERVEHWVTVLCAAVRPPAVRRRQAQDLLKQWSLQVLTNVGEVTRQEVVMYGHALEPAFLVELRGERHAELGVRTATWMRRVLALLLRDLGPQERYVLACGLASSSIVDMTLSSGSVRWLGPALSSAMRLQEFAGPGQILLSEETREALGGRIQVSPIGEVAAGHDWRRRAYALRDLLA
ncbi:MAG: hypothetical protein HY658_06390 [Actinobacteria bacterium]|nr:hypothetical protein [Actinomycetota bacterium]